jgi:hypothetical protein
MGKSAKRGRYSQACWRLKGGILAREEMVIFTRTFDLLD